MKKLTTLIFFLSTVNCYSQITTVTTKEKEEPIEVQRYDSLESLRYENAPLHVGQTLFIIGDSESKDGFWGLFFSKLDDDGSYIYKPTKREDGKIVSSYSELVGKYYKVLSVEVKLSFLGKKNYWLKLVGDDNSPFYLKITQTYGSNKFVTLGYYEKMKQTFVGKEFYSLGESGERPKADSKETVVLPFKTKLKCIDIAVKMGEDEPPFAVLENEKYGKIKERINKGRTLDTVVSISEYNQYVKKYGTKFGSRVAVGGVEIGMNKNMVRDAWGSPDHVNVTQGSYGTHEQWVYGSRYIYFKNGIVTSKQY